MKKVFLVCTLMVGLFFVSCTDETTTTQTTRIETTTEETVVVDYAVLNNSFEEDMDRVLDLSWDTFLSDTYYTQGSNEASDGERSLEVTSLFGGFISVWQVIPIEGADYRNDFDDQMIELQTLAQTNESTMPEIGDKVELSVDLFIDEATPIDNSTPFLIYVESEDINGEKTIICENDVEDVTRGEWFTITTKPAGNSGVIPDDSVLIVISIQLNIPEDGIVYIDNANFGKRVSEDEIITNDNPSYETLGNTVEVPFYSFESNNPFTEEITYSEDAYFGTYSGIIPSYSERSVELSVSEAISSDTASAGIWMKRVSQTGDVSLKLEAFYDGVYHEIDVQTLEQVSVWNFIKTENDDTLLDKEISKLKVTVINDSDHYLFVDYLQAGDEQAFNGNPEKMAFIAYQPWYDSESEGWGNWQYTDASDFDGGVNSYPSRYKDDLRDIASVYYPLIGVYDSSDREVINYHLDLIKAMNIDVIQVNYYADLSQNMLDALQIIFELAEQKDLKVSILYEPKIHIYGWIPHATRMDALAAIEQDLINFIDRYGTSKALLKIDNTPVVEIFGVNILRNSEWKMILENLDDDDYEMYLMGDSIQNSDYSSMKGMFEWNLYKSTLEDATSDVFGQHIQDINTNTLEWAQTNLGYNIPIGIVYPGFDDTKVLGWDLGVARKINQTGPELYQEAWDVFNEMEGFQWVLIATFNDWNEGTIIEPELTWGHQMAIITQKEVADFKGEGIIDSALLGSITTDYLENREHQYD